MADVDDVIVPGIVHWQHPSFFAYFPSNTTYPSILGELLSAGLGVQGMSWVTSPACTELETLVLDWMQELLGLPARFRSDERGGGGVIQGYGERRHARRHPVGALAGHGRRRSNHDGDTSRLVGYVTAQSHSSLEKGLRIAGIGTDRVRVVPHDERVRHATRRTCNDDRRGSWRRALCRSSSAPPAARRRRWRSTRRLRSPRCAGRPAPGCTSTRR